MGLDRTIHLEPFIKIPLQYEHYKRQGRSCGEHEDFAQNKYCPKCGKKITLMDIPDMGVIPVDELIGNENLISYEEEGYMYLLSNYEMHVEIDTSENVFTTITAELISTMIAEFTEQFKNEIKLLQEKIQLPIQVQFGFVYDVH